MAPPLEKTVEQMKEFLGPAFNDNCYSEAKYRASSLSVELSTFKVPKRLEALNKKGEWQQHPVVFIHHGSYEALKNDVGQLVIFLSDKRYISRPYHPFYDKPLYDQAKQLGLTEGNRSFVKSFIKEEE